MRIANCLLAAALCVFCIWQMMVIDALRAKPCPVPKPSALLNEDRIFHNQSYVWVEPTGEFARQ